MAIGSSWTVASNRSTARSAASSVFDWIEPEACAVRSIAPSATSRPFTRAANGESGVWTESSPENCRVPRSSTSPVSRAPSVSTRTSACAFASAVVIFASRGPKSTASSRTLGARRSAVMAGDSVVPPRWMSPSKLAAIRPSASSAVVVRPGTATSRAKAAAFSAAEIAPPSTFHDGLAGELAAARAGDADVVERQQAIRVADVRRDG